MSAQHTEEFIEVLDSLDDNTQKYEVLSIKDKDGFTLARRLAKYCPNEFIQILAGLEDVKLARKVLNIRDNSGYTVFGILN